MLSCCVCRQGYFRMDSPFTTWSASASIIPVTRKNGHLDALFKVNLRNSLWQT
jgi:hypothetical protein